MYIKINDRIFENAIFSVSEGVGELSFKSNEPLSDLEQFFDPSNATVIERYNDDDELVEKWYNNNLLELSYRKIDGEWLIIAKFTVSAMDNDSEQGIKDSIDDTEDALVEVAGLLIDIETRQTHIESNVEAYEKTIREDFERKSTDIDYAMNQHKDSIDKDLADKKSEIDKSMETITKDMASYKETMDENVGKKHSEIDEKYVEQKVILDRLSALYNNLADRVAALENKQ